jgi:hypothetical protein
VNLQNIYIKCNVSHLSVHLYRRPSSELPSREVCVVTRVDVVVGQRLVHVLIKSFKHLKKERMVCCSGQVS